MEATRLHNGGMRRTKYGIGQSPSRRRFSRPFYGEYAWAFDDFLSDDARVSVFAAFAGALRPAGVLLLDVREWEATRDRKQREPVFRKSVLTDRGTLTFTSTTELDPERQQLLLSERHTLVNGAGEHSSEYRFVMRCWTRTELERSFNAPVLVRSSTSAHTKLPDVSSEHSTRR
jgi:hypothetical protein